METKEGKEMKWILFALTLSGFACGAVSFKTDPATVFREAKREHKPVMIDFFGVWCPPCNELDETVFEMPAFLEKAKAFKLLKIDADKTSSWKIKNEYHVGGYPTVVFTDSQGEEIFRFVGYRPLKEVLRIMEMVLHSKKRGYESACQSDAAEDLWRCAVMQSEREEKAKASATYKKLEAKLTPQSPRYAVARAFFVENAETEDLKRDGYERLLKEMPESPLAVYWAIQYFDLFSEKNPGKPKIEILEKVLANFKTAVENPSRDEIGMPLTDMVQLRADLLSKMGKTEESKAAWKDAAILFERLAKELPRGGTARGFTIERISCLEESGDSDAALKLANEYREKYPEEFTFHFKAASILERKKKYNEALPLAQKAYAVSYGDNKIRVATLLINLYATVPDKESAQRIFADVSKEIQPEKQLKVRTHRYLSKLNDAMKKLNG